MGSRSLILWSPRHESFLFFMTIMSPLPMYFYMKHNPCRWNILNYINPEKYFCATWDISVAMQFVLLYLERFLSGPPLNFWEYSFINLREGTKRVTILLKMCLGSPQSFSLRLYSTLLRACNPGLSLTPSHLRVFWYCAYFSLSFCFSVSFWKRKRKKSIQNNEV